MQPQPLGAADNPNLSVIGVNVSHDGRSAVVTIEHASNDFSKAMSELKEGLSVPALAVKAAAEHGMNSDRVSPRKQPYPIDENGDAIPEAAMLVTKPTRYRIDVEVVRPL